METNAATVEPRKGWFARWRAARAERPEVPRIWCVMLLLLSLAAGVITAYGNVQFNEQMALTEAGKQTLMAQSLLIDAFLLTLSGIAGMVWRGRRWAASLLLLALAGGYLTYSAGSYIGFGVGQRLGSTWLAEAKQDEAKKTVKDENDAVLKGRETLLQALKQRYNDPQTSPRERAIIINQLARAAARPVELKAAKIETAVADGQAKVFGGAFGLNQQTVQAAIMAFGAILVVLAKFMGPWIAMAFWPKKPMRWLRRRKPEEEQPIALTAAEPVAAAAAVPAARPEPATKATIDLDREREKALVREWLDTQTVRVARTHAEKAEDVYGWFRDWCQRTKKLGSVMTQTRFGRLTAELDMPKDRKGANVVYRGLMRKPTATPAIPVDRKRKAVA